MESPVSDCELVATGRTKAAGASTVRSNGSVGGGPDGVGVEFVPSEENAGDGWLIGVARLAITDAAAAQPIVRDGAGVAFNGTWPDAGDVARELSEHGFVLATGNDAELVLGRFSTRGDAIGKEVGHHAFAVVDRHGRVLLGRDARGEKPLWVATMVGDDEVVAFASTLPALEELLGSNVPTDLDRLGTVARASYFRFGWWREAELAGRHGAPRMHQHQPDPDPDPEQFDRGAAARGAAARGAVARGAVARGAVADRGPSGHGALAVRQQVVDAAQRAAVADVPVGLALSGGLDSSCLALALRDGPPVAAALSFAAHGAPTNERDAARIVAARTGMFFEEVDAGPEILRELPHLVAHHGLPLGDPSVLALHAVARAARNRHGIKVLLGGEGADEVFGGYRRQRIAAWIDSLRGGGVLGRVIAKGLGALIRATTKNADACTGARARLGRALGGVDDAAFYFELLSVTAPAIREELGVAPGRDTAAMLDDLSSGLDRFAVDRDLYLRHDLLVKVDVATMAAGVEGRCPYLDPAVFALASPASRLGAGPSKPALRAAFAGDLPRAVQRPAKDRLRASRSTRGSDRTTSCPTC